MSKGNLIPCQTAQAKAGEWEIRMRKIGGVAKKSVEFLFPLYCWKSSCHPDSRLLTGHLFCSENVL